MEHHVYHESNHYENTGMVSEGTAFGWHLTGTYFSRNTLVGAFFRDWDCNCCCDRMKGAGYGSEGFETITEKRS